MSAGANSTPTAENRWGALVKLFFGSNRERQSTTKTATLSGVEQIGETAGQVWQLLEAKGPINLARLASELNAPRDTVMQAVGWLAREEKIWIERGGSQTTISLR